MTDAIEAGARALARTFCDHWFGAHGLATHHKMTRDFVNGSSEWQAEAKACIEAAIASGALVPESAVTEMRERCAKAAEDYDGDGLTGSGYEDQLGDARQTKRDIAGAIRQLAIAPASGDYVVVPREPTQAMINAGDEAFDKSEEDQEYQTRGELILWSHSQAIYRAMLNAASSNGGEK